MKKILPTVRSNLAKPTKIKQLKAPQDNLVKRFEGVKTFPEKKSYLDMSTESEGFMTLRSPKGEVLEVIKLVYPR